MTHLHTPTVVRIPGARLGGWLLSLSLIGFVVVVVANVAAFSSSGIGLFAEATRAQFDALGPFWALLALLVLVAATVGNLGVILLSRSLAASSERGRAAARAAGALAATSIALGVVDAVLRISAGGFSEATLGENALYRTAELTGRIAFVAAAAAVVLVAVALFRSGLRRVVGLVITVLAAVLTVIAAVAYEVVPPFAAALLWTPLGIAWLTRLRRS